MKVNGRHWCQAEKALETQTKDLQGQRKRLGTRRAGGAPHVAQTYNISLTAAQLNQSHLFCRSRNGRPELHHGQVLVISSVLPAMAEAPLLRPTSTAITSQRLANLLISQSLRLPRQHHSSSTRLQRLVDAACLCTDRIYDLILPLVFGLLPAIYLSDIGAENSSCCPGLHEGPASQDRDMELPLEAEQLEQIEEAAATLLSSAKVFQAFAYDFLALSLPIP